MSNYLEFANFLAKKAGKFIKKKLNSSNLNIQEKSKNDFVSEVDLGAEKLIIQGIQENFASHSILSEEIGFIDNKSDFLWVIDPLDGTNNFLHNLPNFCVSIGLLYKKEPFIGVIYNPILDYLFMAEKGKGAFLNYFPIEVSNKKTFDSCLFSVPYSLNTNYYKKDYAYNLINLKKNISGFRYSGSLAIDFSYIALGSLDLAWSTTAKPWDIAAVSIIILEAGGVFENLIKEKEGLNLFKGNFIAGNKDLVNFTRNNFLNQNLK